MLQCALLPQERAWHLFLYFLYTITFVGVQHESSFLRSRITIRVYEFFGELEESSVLNEGLLLYAV